MLVGGHPGRLVALSPEGAEALARLSGDGPLSEADRALGRRLVAAGIAHPRLDEGADGGGVAPTVTVVVPARDRSAVLDRLLGSLGDGAPVVVVDDGSLDPAAVAAVCERRGAQLIHRDESGGPGAARNDALDRLDSELVALIDSDCTVADDWLPQLIRHFDDPAIGAVAPRVRPRRPAGAHRVLARFADARSPLDMGAERGEVGPAAKIRYVPTAALVIRRSAMPGRFDPTLRVGEDVDLVWRMCDAGWHVRLAPEVSVWHEEPTSWWAWLHRRFRYGTSAGPLARRHPGRLAPVELRAWPSATVAAALAGRPLAAGGLLIASAVLTAHRVRRHGVPLGLCLRWSAVSAGWTMVGLGHALTTLAWPALLVGARRGRRWAWAAAVLVLTPPLVEWWQRRPAIDPLRWVTACIADDTSYGAGVWVGCIRSRTLGPILPALGGRRTRAVTDQVEPGDEHGERLPGITPKTRPPV